MQEPNMTITSLGTDTVKLLTTTQIITTVSTAVKELIENSLDANAKNISVNLTDKGFTLIKVKDDGCGIPKKDVPLAALSSYTSKISKFSDLESLQTYGFRGEALAALSTVADLTITTKTKEDDYATSYIFDHVGKMVRSEPTHGETGTIVQVKTLFKHMPVRRQALIQPKASNQDMKTLAQLMKSYGMCKYSVGIHYTVDNKVVFAKPSVNSMKEAVTRTLGGKVTSNMSWIEAEDTTMSIALMVPSKAAKDCPEIFQTGTQYIFVNDRPVKHKPLEKIVTTTIMEGLELDSSRKKPIFLLHILINPANIDVNLEPNKNALFFTEQEAVLNTVNKHLKQFYGLEIEEVQENVTCNTSTSSRADNTLDATQGDLEDEWPACKKRKLQTKEGIAKTCVAKDKHIAEESNAKRSNICDPSKTVERASKELQTRDGQSDDKNSKDKNDMLAGFISPNLSDSDSSIKEGFAVGSSKNSTTKQKETTNDDSPPFESSPSASIKYETLSQLPVVDLGDDFDLDEFSKKCEVSPNVKENRPQNINTPAPKQKTCKNTTLLEWSKGHVPGLKGGTDVVSYDNTEWHDSSDSAEQLTDNYFQEFNQCKGFVAFSRFIRSQVLKENPTLTTAQIAHKVTTLWHELTPDEHQFYKEYARDKQTEDKTGVAKKPASSQSQAQKQKKRLTTIKRLLELRQKETMGKTVVTWDLNMDKVTNSFYNNPDCKNESLVIGRLSPKLWIVQKFGRIWVLDVTRLRRELDISDAETSEETKEDVENWCQQWFSSKNDLSLFHPIHPLTAKEGVL